jgi:integrase
MRMLTWDNVNLVDQTAHIEQSKRRAEVFLPISDELHAMLVQQNEDFGFQEYVAPRPRPIHGVYQPYSLTKLPLYAREIMDEAGLPKELRLSDLRRTGTTEMVDAGVGIGQIMSVTGHANAQSVTPYLKNTLTSADYALTQRKNHGTSTASAAKESD